MQLNLDPAKIRDVSWSAVFHAHHGLNDSDLRSYQGLKLLFFKQSISFQLLLNLNLKSGSTNKLF